MLKDIDPYLDVVKTKGRRYGAERKNIIVECLEKMNNGTEITSKHLQDIYGLSAGNAGNVMAKIEKNKNVGRRKDKGRLRLFIERET